MGLAQIPRSNKMTKADRSKWFQLLKWDSEDYLQSALSPTFENNGFTFHRLSKSRWFVEIITGAGAYQKSYVFAILDESNPLRPKVSELLFTDYYLEKDGKVKKETTKFLSGTPTFDPKTKTLKVFYKAAGLGHCGSLTSYKISKNITETIEARVRNCDDATSVPPPEEWPRIKLF